MAADNYVVLTNFILELINIFFNRTSFLLKYNICFLSPNPSKDCMLDVLLNLLYLPHLEKKNNYVSSVYINRQILHISYI